jgi:hypothetical protein
MGVPLRLYHQLAQALSLGGSKMIDATSSWFSRIGETINDRVALAQTTKQHWRQLYSALLPLEPDVLGLFVAYELARRKSDVVPVRRRYRRATAHPAIAYEEAASLLVEHRDSTSS